MVQVTCVGKLTLRCDCTTVCEQRLSMGREYGFPQALHLHVIPHVGIKVGMEQDWEREDFEKHFSPVCFFSSCITLVGKLTGLKYSDPNKVFEMMTTK